MSDARPTPRRPRGAWPLLAAALALAGCGGPDAEDAAQQANARRAAAITIPVRVKPAAGGTVTEALAIQGRLEVWRREIISAPVAGVIRAFPGLPDQVVKAGDLVLQLDPPPGEDEELAKAALKRDRAKRSLDRLEYLQVHAPVTVAAVELEGKREEFADADNELDLLRRRAPKRRLVAPFAGVLVKFQGVVGDAVAEGAKVAELLDPSRYRIRLELPETSLRRLSLGQSVEVRALADDSRATGTVASLPAAIDAEKGIGQVVIDTAAPPATWRPGGFVTARLVLKQTAGAVVLSRAQVAYEDNRAYCWVADRKGGAQVARRAWLELGANDEQSVVVTKGLTGGDQVIVDGLEGISDGIRISIPAAAAAPAPAIPATAAPAPVS